MYTFGIYIALIVRFALAHISATNQTASTLECLPVVGRTITAHGIRETHVSVPGSRARTTPHAVYISRCSSQARDINVRRAMYSLLSCRSA
ncbi:hypothetical protein BU23DRAFT_90180 [Bimuria novae-zelandiae CBS 107.79]|uniref:Secreted protein n=1 Tax=Bimuria novae-zelandiae CBS 107.79 TaxID=1447943 RepID=A0A6A5VCC4_9PLEO|nr:hypothetical protein BU23DRAFT_90180 [Bimuria novae-zelandiae CBS 107.79]